MNCELRKLSLEDGMDVYGLLQQIPADENGYINEMKDKTVEDYQAWLIQRDLSSRQVGIVDGWKVPTNTYWLYVDKKPVAMGKIRHFLTDRLREEGGSIGYAVCPGERGKGYGGALLRGLLKEAGRMGQDKVLLTIRKTNTPSIKLALSCGGVLAQSNNLRHYIWVDCAED